MRTKSKGRQVNVDVAVADGSRARKAAIGSFVGAVVEWYDFLLYGIIAALVFNSQFFPSVSPAVGVMAAFATFGVGFLFRPLGGIFFGHFGDRLGRKRMLIWTMLLMGVATALIGLVPNFESIGWFAPLLLVLLRAIQGFAVGGEWGGASLMAVESAPAKKKAFYSSGVQVGYSVGLILATGAVTIMSNLLSDDAFTSWGWRVPFLASAVLVLFGLWIRSGVEESPVFEQAVEESGEKKKLPVIQAITEHPGSFLKIISLRMAELFTMYIVTTFALSYTVNELGYERQFMLNVALLVGAIGILSIPAYAAVADRFGRKPIFVTGAVVGALAAVPFFLSLQAASVVAIVILAVILVNVSHDMVVSVQQPLFTEMFGPELRYSGAGVGYQVASAIAGGFTPFIAAALVSWNDGSWHYVAAYLALGCIISAVVAALMKNMGSSDVTSVSVQTPAAEGVVAERVSKSV
ncbi:MFS transporter [Rhodococcus sp. 14-2496-1d]|nr:MFS transporter [Rhodococcus sp. 14-2496-1d]